VRLLLDTHVAFWWFNELSRVGGEARVAIEDPASEVWISSASVWEAGLKTATGKLKMQLPFDELAARAGMLELPVTWAHARAASDLPRLHGDPVDRMLVAQAKLEDLILVTRDRLVCQYDIVTMPA
jgi:PIN domain nuclease of toxin-antitoxin system